MSEKLPTEGTCTRFTQKEENNLSWFFDHLISRYDEQPANEASRSVTVMWEWKKKKKKESHLFCGGRKATWNRVLYSSALHFLLFVYNNSITDG